jgi:hypothetical protein
LIYRRRQSGEDGADGATRRGGSTEPFVLFSWSARGSGSGCWSRGRGGRARALLGVRREGGRGGSTVARRRRRQQSQDIATSDVVVGGEEGDAVVDGGIGRRAGRGERGGDRVTVGDAIAWSVAVSGGGRSGGEGEGHGGEGVL